MVTRAPLFGNGSLVDLDEELLADLEQRSRWSDRGPWLGLLGHRRRAVVVEDARRRVDLLLAGQDLGDRRAGLDFAAAGRRRDVEEGVALEADVDERRLHAGQHPRHPPLVDVADDAAMVAALEEDLGQPIVFEHRDAGLVRVALDEHLVGHRTSGEIVPAGPIRSGNRRSCARSLSRSGPRPAVAGLSD